MSEAECQREWAKPRERAVKYAVVSITDPNRPRLQFPEDYSLRHVLHLQFADILQPIGSYEPMNRDQAQEVVDFLHRTKDEVDVYQVHCHAGISRSPAVAAAMAAILGYPINDFWDCLRMPNGWVLSLVMALLPYDNSNSNNSCKKHNKFWGCAPSGEGSGL